MIITEDIAVQNIDYSHYSSIYGCCGMGAVARLKSNSKTARYSAQEQEEWSVHPQSVAMLQSPLFSLKTQIERLKERPPHLTRSYATANWYALRIPPEIAFAAVLQDIIAQSGQSIYLLTDNISETGDCHLGPVSPRKFARWFQLENLGTVHTTGPVPSNATDQHIQGWFLVINRSRCMRIVEDAKTWLKQEIDNANQTGKLKQHGEDRRAETARAESQLTREILSGWRT